MPSYRFLVVFLFSIVISFNLLLLSPVACFSNSSAEAKLDELYRKYEELNKKKLYSEAVKYAKELVPAGEEALGKEHAYVGIYKRNLADLYRKTGDYAKAEPLYKSSLVILEKALDADIDMPFSCQGGICTSCRGKLLSGRVEMEDPDGLSDEEIEAGYILTCVSHPLSKDVKINIE